MLTIIVRSLQTAISVVVGIATASLIGDANTAKLIAVPIAAVVMGVIEYALMVAPRQSVWARRHLDPRSVFEGVWIQDVKRGRGEQFNRFAVFTVSYSGRDSEYRVEGTAYDGRGIEHSRWRSDELVHFSRDGQSMTYLWAGDVVGESGDAAASDRRGFARLWLSSSNGGTGRVDHVSMAAVLHFNIVRVTADLIPDPAVLADPTLRDVFALDYADRL